jgi:hypothetical protein
MSSGCVSPSLRIDIESLTPIEDFEKFQVILNNAPSRVLTSEEKGLVWKYQFYLARDKRGLTKFVNSVTW